MELGKSSVTYAHAKLKVDDYWNRGVTGSGIKIGVVDDGMGTHPALPISGGYACGKHTTYMQENRHATHCAGIALARNLKNGDPVGIAPDVELYSIRMYYATYEDRVRSLIEAIDYAIAEGIDILSMSIHIMENSFYSSGGGSSLGTPKHMRIPMREAFYKAFKNGIIVVVAAGNQNDGSGEDDIEFGQLLPKMPGVVTVANLTPIDERRKTSGVGRWVDVAGYGTFIKSTVPGGGYEYMTGTSMATPQIAGVLALYKQLLNELEEEQTFSNAGGQTITTKRRPPSIRLILDKFYENCVPVHGLNEMQQGRGVPQPPPELYELPVLPEANPILRFRHASIWRAIDKAYYRDGSQWKEMEAMGYGGQS